MKVIGESRSQAIWHFMSLDNALAHKNRFKEVITQETYISVNGLGVRLLKTWEWNLARYSIC